MARKAASTKSSKKGFDVKKGALTQRIGKPTKQKVEADKAKQNKTIRNTKPSSAAHKAAVKKKRQDTFALNAKAGFKKRK